MALNEWLLKRYRELSLKVTQVDGTQEWLPGCCDLQVSIALGGRQYIGRGVAEDSDLALTKAGAEALERAFCFEHNISTCGVAVHTEEQSAKINARNELVERDRFFCHYLTATPFEEVKSDEHGDLFKKLKEYGVVMNVLGMTPLNDILSFVCLSQGEKTGLILGLGSFCEKAVAVKKAVAECLINTLATLHGVVKPLGFDEFEQLPVCQPEDHRRLYLGEPELMEKNRWMLVGGRRQREGEWIDEESFEYFPLCARHELLEESPVVAVKCENKGLQRSYYGNVDPKQINVERIGQFRQVAGMNPWPHPLG